MNFGLPVSVELSGKEYPIRTDYRDILNLCVALSDPELSQEDKAIVSLVAFYPTIDEMPETEYEEAIKECFKFINAGQEDEQKQSPKLVDWEQDFQYIVSPINRVIGKEIRSVEYLHWWTFLSAYYEIGDCLFAQIVRIRDAQARGKKLSKEDREWARKNANLVRFKNTFSQAEEDAISAWI